MNLDKEITKISLGSINQNRLTARNNDTTTTRLAEVTAYMPRNLECWQWSAKEGKEAGGRETAKRNGADSRNSSSSVKKEENFVRKSRSAENEYDFS